MNVAKTGKRAPSLSYERNLYRDLVASVPVGVYRLRVTAARKWVVREWVARLATNYTIEMASDAFCRVLGVTQAQRKANAQIVAERIHPDDRADFIACNVISMNALTTFRWEGRILKGREVRCVNFTSVPRPLENGDVLWTGVLQDITERKQSEEALRESEERFRTLFDSSPDPAWIIDEHRFVECNQAAVDMLGYPDKDSLKNAHPSKLSPKLQPDGESSYGKAERMMAIAQEKGFNRFDWVHRRRDQTDFVAEVTLSAILLQGRRVLYCTWKDITEPRLAVQALRESEERYRLMAEAVPHLAWRCDATGLTIECNRRWYDYTGQTPARARGTGWMRALHPADRSRVMQQVKDDVAGGTIYRATYRIRRASDGAYRWHLAQALPVKDRTGEILGWFGSAADIEDQKRAEDTLRQANEQLESKVRDRTSKLRALAAELTRAEHKERRRIACLLHEDLQQRLAAIKYKVHELKDSAPRGSALRTANQAIRELAEAIELTRDLTTRLAPPVLYLLGLRPALEALSKEMAAHFSLSVQVTGLRAFQLPSDAMRHFAFDAVRELLLNVAKHAGVKSAEIRIKPAGKTRIAVEVHDEGKGFSRTCEPTDRFGLFSIRERAEAMGIGFHISSRPGKGTCAALVLPLLCLPQSPLAGPRSAECGAAGMIATARCG